MGLSIHLDVTASEAINDITGLDNALHEREGLRILGSMDPDRKISVYPGSYSGLHLVRAEYAKLKGWPVDGVYSVPIDSQTEGSHLVNHSDCDGYYLPDDFPEPQWIQRSEDDAISVGSSHRLLDEMCELLAVKDKWPEHFQERWDAVFIAALVSVTTHTVIRFS